MDNLRILEETQFGGKGVGSLETNDLALGEWECHLKIEVVNIKKEKATFKVIFRNIRELGNSNLRSEKPYELFYAAPYGSSLDESTEMLEFLGYDVVQLENNDGLRKHDEIILDELDEIAHNKAQQAFNRLVGMLI